MQNSATENPCTIITAADTAEPHSTKKNLTFKKRIRTTNYIVGIYFSTTTKENVSDKVLRLIKGDIAKSSKSNFQ